MQHALMSERPQEVGPSATYGALLHAAGEAVGDANAYAPRIQDPAQMTNELLGYERFLRTAGSHLRALDDVSGVNLPALHQLNRHLSALRVREVEEGYWYRSAHLLGAAHDLFATHVDGSRPRSPEAVEWLMGPRSLGGCQELLSLLIDGHQGAEALIKAIAMAHRRGRMPARMKVQLARVRSMNSHVGVLTKAALWELSASGLEPFIDDLDGLRPRASALTLRDEGGRRSDPLVALRVLRQITFLQAEGRVPASPASLRDLAELATRITSIPAPIPAPQSALARVRQAHARDQLREANTAWNRAGEGLTERVLGLSRAPAQQRLAIDLVANAGEADDRARAAIHSALPQLADDAASTVRRMVERGTLLTRQQVFCQPRKHWQRIEADDGADLVARFGDAASASRNLAVVTKDLQPPPQASGPTPPRMSGPTVPAPRVGLA